MRDTKPLGTTCELWDLASRNLVGEFAGEREALALVRVVAEEHGREAAGFFALVREDEHGDSATVAMGADLVDRALQEVAVSLEGRGSLPHRVAPRPRVSARAPRRQG